MAQIKEEIELKIAELQMDYYVTDNNFANANDYVKSELEKGVELPSGAVITVDSNGNLSYEEVEIGSLNPDGSVTIDGEFNGSQIVTKYTVSYNPNGGQGGPSSKRYAAGESVTVDFTTKPTKKGANFLGWARSSTATTPEYTTSGSFSMGTQNVTLYAVWEAWPLATETISATNYGNKVSYTANGVSDWQVFLNDGSNVYLISSDYVPSSGMKMTSDVTKMEGSDYKVKGNSRDGLLNWLKVSDNWESYKTNYVDIATGAPTKVQFVESYNAKYGTSFSSGLNGDSDQFTITNNVAPYMVSDKDADFRLASENSVNVRGIWVVQKSGLVTGNSDYATMIGIRPLVRLKSNIKMNWNGTAWDLSE